MRPLHLTLSYCFLLLSCKNITESSRLNHPNFDDKYTIAKKEDLIFPLDSLAARFSLQVAQYHTNEDGKEFIYILDWENHRILCYDYFSSKFECTIELQKEGPNGIGSIIGSGFYVHNTDSIFIQSFLSQKLFLVNSKGNLLDKYPLGNTSEEPSISGSVFTFQALLKHGDKFFMNNAGNYYSWNKEELTPPACLLSINIATKEKKYYLKYPEIYSDGVWQNRFHQMKYTINPTSGEVACSFPIDQNIWVYDPENGINSYYASSELIEAPFPFSDQDIKEEPNQNASNDYFRSQSYFTDIIYDPYSKFYFRNSILKWPQSVIASENPNYQRSEGFSLGIILDERFNKVGEVADIYGAPAFVNPNGIFLRNYEYDPENEDIIVFSRYQFEKK